MAKAKPIEPKAPDCLPVPLEQMGLKELERIRLILRGGSIIEWRRLHFRSRDEVDSFIRRCLLDPQSPQDQAWMRTVLADAVEYLRKTFNYKVAEAVANPEEIHDLFLFASGIKKPHRYRRIACVVLKVMHVIQHVEGRDLLFRLDVSEAEISHLITQRVVAAVNELREKGLDIVEFANSVKTRDALITKLLAKRETVAAQIYDRTRFRIVTRNKEDIIPVLYFLTQRLFPFNFVVPGQTENSLIVFKDLLNASPQLKRFSELFHLHLDYEEQTKRRTRNRFSGPTYEVLNFVVDIPLRMDSFLPPPKRDFRLRRNRIGFALVEFQIVDERTAQSNELGENSHEQYKARQKTKVLRRLSRGLVVPRPKNGTKQAPKRRRRPAAR